LIPKPLDPRLITTIAPAVARAAMESGIAKQAIIDWEAYNLELQERIGIDQRLMLRVVTRAKKDPKRVVFAEADNVKILKAVQILRDEKVAIPILLGRKHIIDEIIEENKLDLTGVTIVDPYEDEDRLRQYGNLLFEKRKRKGLTPQECYRLMKDRNYFGSMMVELGEADALISGLTKDYPKTILPALHVIGVSKGTDRVAGMYIMNTNKGPFFFSDTTVNVNPTAEQLVEIVGLTAQGVRFFDIDPKIAILSYSNFGSAKGEVASKTAKATVLAKAKFPELVIEGEMQANVALNEEIQLGNYPFSALIGNKANTLIFPDLSSGNIAYKLLSELGHAEAIGPVLLGMNKPVHILQLGSSIREIVNMVAIAVVDAQTNSEK
jgi:malate dehydrogenase (oxaloacetate-decarboxylating)(NADP+)